MVTLRGSNRGLHAKEKPSKKERWRNKCQIIKINKLKEPIEYTYLTKYTQNKQIKTRPPRDSIFYLFDKTHHKYYTDGFCKGYNKVWS